MSKLHHNTFLQLDGWIARTWESQSSNLGSFLDPMADKVLIATLFLSLTYADLIPVALTGMIIARDVILVTAGFVIRYRSLPPPVSTPSHILFTFLKVLHEKKYYIILSITLSSVILVECCNI